MVEVMNNEEEFSLNRDERYSALWKKLTKHLAERIDEARRKNDSDLNEIETATLRGRIKELSYLVSLGNESEPENVADHDD
jgi:hypothetical protein